ncbi:MAG: bifunctional folylpolyglutamate synthase/dihydrofolate synthase, partial [Oscillospiraceae bacterium]|nr:bifunctional folylpolyglutamate synthase/dihydrofolate synthase [Oscillospiraceae bacterium]
PFLGRHQALNAAMAVEICLALWRKGYEVEDEAILQGLEKASFPARIEVLRKEPLVLLDGCHNPDGAKALAAVLNEAECETLTLVMGMMGDKDAAPCLKALGPYCARLLAVTPEGPRAMPAEQLATLGRKYIGRVETRPSLEAALEEALEAGNDLLVCGSLYMAAEARPYLLGKLKKKSKK